MKTSRRLLLRVVAAALALLATITWSAEAMADTSPSTAAATVYVAPSIGMFERVVTPLPKDTIVTTFTVGWGGGQ